MSATILVVEDETELKNIIQMTLRVAGYDVLTAGDGYEALNILHQQPIDLIIADIAMPKMNGYQLLEQVRENPAWIVIPFIFMTGRTLDSDVYYGKTLGADDYLTKPVNLNDLRATVAGKLKRAQQLAQISRSEHQEPVIVVGDLRIDLAQHRIWKDDQLIELSPREFTLLAYLAQRPGDVVPLTELCRVTHELETDPTEAGSLLYPLVRSLRRRLGHAAGDMGDIESVRSVGYRLKPPGE